MLKFVSCESFPGGPHEPTLETVLCVPKGCHGAPLTSHPTDIITSERERERERERDFCIDLYKLYIIKKYVPGGKCVGTLHNYIIKSQRIITK